MASEKASAIRRRREAAGLTQDQAAARCGWTQPQWSMFENGRYKRATVRTLRLVAKALGCKVTDLLD